MQTTHQYNIFIKDLSAKIWELLPKDWSFTDELNHESTAQFSISFQEFKKIAEATGSSNMAIFTASFREIWIERDGSKIFWGALTSFDIDPTDDGEMTMKLNAVSWFGIFQKRFAGIPKRVFTGVDAGEIAWTLIDESQSSDSTYSDLGITEGSITASKNRDRTYKFDNVKESIIKLSNDNLADGFDFEIDNSKAFNVHYPTRGTIRNNIIFDFDTMKSFKYHKPLIFDLANKVHVVGAGDNDDVLYTTRTAATGYRTDWHTLEEKMSETDIIELATLQDKGDRKLANSQTPVIAFTVEHYDTIIQWSHYDVGDTVRANLPELGMTNEAKRVRSRKFTMDATKSIGVISSVLI